MGQRLVNGRNFIRGGQQGRFMIRSLVPRQGRALFKVQRGALEGNEDIFECLGQGDGAARSRTSLGG